MSGTRKVLVAALMVASACVVAPTPSPSSTSAPPDNSATSPPPPSTTPATTPPAPPSSTGEAAEPVAYAAVAGEEAGRLWIIALLPDQEQADCGERGDEGCGPLGVVASVSTPPGPHNVAAYGPVVLVTHPSEGVVTRYDVETGELTSAPVGIEPHDVDFAPDGGTAYVTDESGGRLLTVDTGTLETLAAVDLPGRPHDSVVDGDSVWVTMIGRSELARVRAGGHELVEVGGSPHDLVMDGKGRIWLTHWSSHRLTVFDPGSGGVEEAPAGVMEPHHFTTTPDGSVWISDNGADSVVKIVDGEPPLTITVGPTPHHLALLDPYVVVAVSGRGALAVVDQSGEGFGGVPLGRGLHGVAVGEADEISP